MKPAKNIVKTGSRGMMALEQFAQGRQTFKAKMSKGLSIPKYF